jgi:hypothetical protein
MHVLPRRFGRTPANAVFDEMAQDRHKLWEALQYRHRRLSNRGRLVAAMLPQGVLTALRRLKRRGRTT